MKLEQVLVNECRGTDRAGNSVVCIIPSVGNCMVSYRGTLRRFRQSTAAISFAAELCDYDYAEDAEREGLKMASGK